MHLHFPLQQSQVAGSGVTPSSAHLPRLETWALPLFSPPSPTLGTTSHMLCLLKSPRLVHSSPPQATSQPLTHPLLYSPARRSLTLNLFDRIFWLETLPCAPYRVQAPYHGFMLLGHLAFLCCFLQRSLLSHPIPTLTLLTALGRFIRPHRTVFPALGAVALALITHSVCLQFSLHRPLLSPALTFSWLGLLPFRLWRSLFFCPTTVCHHGPQVFVGRVLPVSSLPRPGRLGLCLQLEAAEGRFYDEWTITCKISEQELNGYEVPAPAF